MISKRSCWNIFIKPFLFGMIMSSRDELNLSKYSLLILSRVDKMSPDLNFTGLNEDIIRNCPWFQVDIRL